MRRLGLRQVCWRGRPERGSAGGLYRAAGSGRLLPYAPAVECGSLVRPISVRSVFRQMVKHAAKMRGVPGAVWLRPAHHQLAKV